MRELELYLNSCDSDPDKHKHDSEPVESLEKKLRDVKTLEELQSLMKTVETPLKENSTNFVFYDGVETSKVMLIGEAPGREEDLRGKPFVGQSGQLLDRILLSIGLSRTAGKDLTTVYITNVLPWRPPGNRTPTQKETEQFLPYLKRHIGLISPEVIVLLGAIALRAFFPQDGGILRERGIWKQIKIGDRQIPTIATFHPAFLLRQASRKREVWEDMKSLKSKLGDIGII